MKNIDACTLAKSRAIIDQIHSTDSLRELFTIKTPSKMNSNRKRKVAPGATPDSDGTPAKKAKIPVSGKHCDYLMVVTATLTSHGMFGHDGTCDKYYELRLRLRRALAEYRDDDGKRTRRGSATPNEHGRGKCYGRGTLRKRLSEHGQSFDLGEE